MEPSHTSNYRSKKLLKKSQERNTRWIQKSHTRWIQRSHTNGQRLKNEQRSHQSSPRIHQRNRPPPYNIGNKTKETIEPPKTKIGPPCRRKEPSRHTPPPHQSSTTVMKNHHCKASYEADNKTFALKTEQNGEEAEHRKGRRWGLSRRWRGAPVTGEEEAK
ncbi:unnamed protein product [Microthlaspi erraticum]|uniref:Uncharacterized protein n=1 Tax=Microthlaspi erraticum TaxID=1685480 RepID=A0A6D2IBU7_9BRAS|nr:unnamed protein product [Microthlaspi erraticum]